LKKKLSFKELDKLLKEAVDKHSASLFYSEAIDFVYDHYCPEVQTVFITENPGSPVEVTYEKVEPLKKEIQKISSRIQLSIFYEAEDFGNTKD
tara:strand:- start:1 stop:279 length:279 start_codon:yes stop_codon:yes gene_type:complete